jgi:ribonuclease HII
VAGVDEVGRGAWAGPLSVGVAVVHPRLRNRSMPEWLRDSKTLPEERRESAFGQVAAWCADAAVGHASAEECDRWGMTLAWRLAAYRALAQLEVEPDAIVIDGPHDLLRGARPAEGAVGVGDTVTGPPLPAVRLPVTVMTKVDADATCAAVAAASVLAKVVRDRWMREEAVHFPPYGFDRNKGYPSPRHQIALRGYGLSAIHRRSWTFVTDLPWR